MELLPVFMTFNLWTWHAEEEGASKQIYSPQQRARTLNLGETQPVEIRESSRRERAVSEIPIFSFPTYLTYLIHKNRKESKQFG